MLITIGKEEIPIPKKNRVTVICDNCGKEYSIKESQYKKSKSHYCSIECKAEAQKKMVTFNCENCGKEVQQKLSHYNRNEHHYCSVKCQKEFQHKRDTETRICPICGKEFVVGKMSPKRFCSIECQHEWQKTQIGILNPRYNRQIVTCEWCGEDFEVKNYRANSDNHKFCSTKCRQEWYSKVWSQQEEWRKESKERAAKILSDRKIDTDTKPQRIVNFILDSMNVKYTNEGNFKYYSVDNYLDDYNLIIEVMGDYWHGNPTKYPYHYNDLQYKTQNRDRAKHNYILDYHNIEILYLWENDLYKQFHLCELLIKKYIDNNGVLENYHSFNYHINRNKLLLNGDIIIPYSDNSYKHKESVETVIPAVATQ